MSTLPLEMNKEADASGPVLTIDRWPTNGHLFADCARLGLLRPEWRTLDVTYGYGTFWNVWRPDELDGSDLNPAKSPIGYPVDYTALPFADRSYAAVVFDPDYKLTGTPWDTGGMDERYGTEKPMKWQDRMGNIRAGARECARVSDRMLLVKCQDQVVSSKIRWQTKAVADEVEPLGFGLKARFEFLGGRAQPAGRRQINPNSCSSQLLVFERCWKWSDLDGVVNAPVERGAEIETCLVCLVAWDVAMSPPKCREDEHPHATNNVADWNEVCHGRIR